MSENPEKPDKSLMIYGRDVSQIPCFRNSFLYGTLGGLGLGLVHFMFTSKVPKSVNYSVYSFSVITMGYWMVCRYNYSKLKFELTRTQELLRDRIATEGTEQEYFQPEKVEVVEVLEVHKIVTL
ncbi:cytochrome c oxidase assembly protein COX20, mitochondrial [Anthonomus grandis grandis]|uniref:cytochrome c oxidase assembly protein COX20, mitochondrial n=1 Tax=Anthonomus grandis grandis TaxID=2921223 RepID=UPI002165BD32|nr:cytochrome c oxidase assembly protein COX20, mitochondrial [Anthonomus grandis grandis]